MNYYTLQIHYNSTQQPLVYEMKDLTPGDDWGGDVEGWKKEIQRRLYQNGFSIMTAPGSYQLFSPFSIVTAYLIKQDKKFAL